MNVHDPEDINGDRHRRYRQELADWATELWKAHDVYNEAFAFLNTVKSQRVLWTRLSEDCETLMHSVPANRYQIHNTLRTTKQLADNTLRTLDQALRKAEASYDQAYYALKAVKERKP